MHKRRKKVKPMKVKRKKRAKDEVNGQGGKGGCPSPTRADIVQCLLTAVSTSAYK